MNVFYSCRTAGLFWEQPTQPVCGFFPREAQPGYIRAKSQTRAYEEGRTRTPMINPMAHELYTKCYSKIQTKLPVLGTSSSSVATGSDASSTRKKAKPRSITSAPEETTGLTPTSMQMSRPFCGSEIYAEKLVVRYFMLRIHIKNRSRPSSIFRFGS